MPLVDSEKRREYGHPTLEEWQRLERGGIVPFDDGTLFVLMDQIH